MFLTSASCSAPRRVGVLAASSAKIIGTVDSRASHVIATNFDMPVSGYTARRNHVRLWLPRTKGYKF